jgi:cytochrome c oxidase subunit 1
VTFFTQFVMGSRGMPRRYYDYPERFTGAHQLSTAGSYLMALGFFAVLAYLLHSLYRGRPAAANPWGGNSLEWHTPSPPPHDNFERVPEVEDPYDFGRWSWDAAAAGYRRDAERAP